MDDGQAEGRRAASKWIIGCGVILGIAVIVPTTAYILDSRSADRAEQAAEVAVAEEVGFTEAEIEWSDTVERTSPRDSVEEINVVVSGTRQQEVLRVHGAAEVCRLKSFGESFPRDVTRPDETVFRLYATQPVEGAKDITVIVVGDRSSGSVVFLSKRPDYSETRNVCA